MNNLITKTVFVTTEELGNSLLYVLFCLVCSLVIATISYFVYDKYTDIISGLVTLVAIISSIFLFIILIKIIWSLCMHLTTKQPVRAVIPEDISITEIKEHIKIDNNRLTIDPLPENYQYKDDVLDRTKPHDFKIDDFYKETNVKLIDSNNNTYEITHDQLEELKR